MRPQAQVHTVLRVRGVVAGTYMKLISLLLAALIVFICFDNLSAQEIPQFDGASAFTFLYRQVSMGPREPGSEVHEQAVEDYIDWFRRCGGQVHTQSFEVEIHTSPDKSSARRRVAATNVIARFGPEGSLTYLLCAHYDTRPWADLDQDSLNHDKPIPGANDGASGVAVLLEMARLFAISEPPVPVEIVLFDVEDSGVPGDNETYCLGSAYYVRHYAGSAPAGVVLVDMVGDADLEIPKEYFSNAYAPEWIDYLFKLAAEVNSDVFVDRAGAPVYDDHVHFLRAGIPACNLIDFDYRYWHTMNDVPEACAPESLEQVGRVLVRLVYGE